MREPTHPRIQPYVVRQSQTVANPARVAVPVVPAPLIAAKGRVSAIPGAAATVTVRAAPLNAPDLNVAAGLQKISQRQIHFVKTFSVFLQYREGEPFSFPSLIEVLSRQL